MLTRTILPIMKCLLPSLVLTGLLIAVSYFFVRAEELATRPSEEARETRLQSLKQLTFGGQNAEAYFSLDGGKIIFQATRPPFECDQVFSMNVDGSDVRLLSTGKGRTTCGFFFPEGKQNHCLSSLPPKDQGRVEGLRISARAESDQAESGGNLHDVRRRRQQTANNQQRHRELGAVPSPQQPADYLFVKPSRS